MTTNAVQVLPQVLFYSQSLKTQISTVLKKFDISHQQYKVLEILYQSSTPLNAKEICLQMLQENSNVTRLVDGA